MIKANDKIKKFVEFLNRHKVTDKESPCTHTSMGIMFGKLWAGKYFINDDYELCEFLELYSGVLGCCNDLEKSPLHIVERPRYISKILVDIDFRQDIAERCYTLETIKYMITTYKNVMNNYLKVPSNNYEALVFEKTQPKYDENQKNYKDGFHIVFPYIIVSAPYRYRILDDVRKCVEVEDGLSDVPYTNSLSDIFDDSIVIKNGWMMYGSRKNNSTQSNPENTCQTYHLTYIFDNDMNELDLEMYEQKELVSLLSVRNNIDDDHSQLLDECNTEEFIAEMEEYEQTRKSKQKKLLKNVHSTNGSSSSSISSTNNTTLNKTNKLNLMNKLKQKNYTNTGLSDSAIMATKLVDLLSDERADSYNKWLQVGWALHNVDKGLLDCYINFSKRCENKYKDGCCEEIWANAKELGDKGLTLASLYWWAKEDNPDGYINLLKEYVNKKLEKADSGNHDDIACVIHELYKFDYVCASIKKNKWYEFQQKQHRWIPVDSAYTLLNKISTEVANEFLKLSSVYLSESTTKDGFEKDNLMNKSSKIIKIAGKLRNHDFKEKVIKACACLFYEDNFEQKLDSNEYLLGFNNGVYDFNTKCFRDGMPSDYLTMSVGYDYKEFSPTDKKIKEIESFFAKVQRESDMREYVLTLISSYLVGTNKDQKFILWTGCGSNGKSTVMDLIRLTFGEYFGTLPNTILTRKQANANNATPELADKRGKRCLAIQEPEYDDTIHVGYMKQLTGRDMVNARALYGDPFTYLPQFKLILTCNDLPKIPANDGGTWRRIRVSPFESEFVDDTPNAPHQFKKDPLLEAKIKTWPQAFIWMLINIYYPIYDSGPLKEPAKVTSRTNNYKKEEDIYSQFLTDTVTHDPDDHIEVVHLYNTFKNWYAERSSIKRCPGLQDLTNYLTKNGYKTVKNNSKTYIQGITFTPN